MCLMSVCRWVIGLSLGRLSAVRCAKSPSHHNEKRALKRAQIKNAALSVLSKRSREPKQHRSLERALPIKEHAERLGGVGGLKRYTLRLCPR